MKTFTRACLLPALALLLGLTAMPGAASAGVATSGAVLLDPFDPVPEIQFHHFGGYGCSYGCGAGYYGGCDDVCGGYDRCGDGCGRRYHRHYRRYARDCDRDCGRDEDRDEHRDHEADATCTSAHCYNAEHYERRWRDGDRIGQEWEDRGRREQVLPDEGHAAGFYGREYDWHDEGAPDPVVVIQKDDHHDDHDDHHHHDHDGH